MELDVSQSNSAVYVKNHDKCVETPEKHMKWMNVKYVGGDSPVPYHHTRMLPHSTGKKALKYIEAITSEYPFQIRYAMMLPLWYRFTEAWCDSGDEKVSLLAI